MISMSILKCLYALELKYLTNKQAQLVNLYKIKILFLNTSGERNTKKECRKD